MSQYSSKIVRILAASRAEARRLHLTTVTPATLLLGILRLEDSIAYDLIMKAGISADKLRQTTERYLFATNPQAKVQYLEPKPDEPQISSLEDAEVALDTEVTRLLKFSDLVARHHKAPEANDAHLLLAILRDRDNEGKRLLLHTGLDYAHLRSSLAASSNFPPEVLNATSPYALAESGDPSQMESVGVPLHGTATNPDPTKSSTPILDTYTIDLTAAATRGELDPVIGRDADVERMVQILSRRKKNNPIVIGLPGVGKTALIEGLAQKIVAGQVPSRMRSKRILSLDMATIVAGTQYRGQFEERMRRLITELSQNPDTIIYIDEIHTLIGAGGAPGSLDAAAILKPALTRGQVQCIGATTTAEYRNTIEKDGALNRRFQKIQIEPTSVSDTLAILRQLKARYELHHNVIYNDEALDACVTLSDRYLTHRALPDKAIDALDEAGARAHLLTDTLPSEIEQMQQRLLDLRQQKLAAAAIEDYNRATALRDQAVCLEGEIEEATKAWRMQHSDEPVHVDAETIADVISSMSGVPVTAVTTSETQKLRTLHDTLSHEVIAQDKAVSQVSHAISRARLGLKDPKRPIGAFLFVGPTGVGKTHLVQTLARHLFGTDQALIRIDMSEYGEKFMASRLVGAPPGYVGYDKGGQLTEQVRRHPYSVVLFDEIEKAHNDVYNTLLSVMDEGRLTDSDGTTVDFRNVIMVMTSNCGSRDLSANAHPLGFGSDGTLSAEDADRIVRAALRKQFPPEFLNRIDDIISFAPLTMDSICKITRLQAAQLSARISALGHTITFTDDVIQYLAHKAYDPAYGARPIRRILQQYVEDPLCDQMLVRDAAKGCQFQVSLESDAISITCKEKV